MTTPSAPKIPETRYALSEGVSIAYQVVGEGPIDLVMVPGFGSHLERAWELPRLAHYYHRLSSFSRLVLLDKRGTGLSDRVSPDHLPGIEQRMHDLRAVMDDVGLGKVSLVAHSDGGPLAILFAATFPTRVENLVLINTYPKRISSPEFPGALSPEFFDGFLREVTENWGQPILVDSVAPGSDPDFHRWWAASLRASMSPAAARAMVAMNRAIDVREALPAIHVPTLVIHRTDDGVNPLEGARYMAEHIEGARLLELPGADHFPWMGDSEAILAAIEEFTTGTKSGGPTNQVLASLLFTDIVGSTEKAAELGDREWASLLRTHDGIVDTEVSRHSGREVKHTGDGSLSVFEGPARAVRCWLSIAHRVGEIGITIRGSVHTSEVDLVDGDVRGIGVHIAARLMGLAGPGELIVSSVVRDLSVGSGLEFADRGSHELKGVPGEWAVFGLMA